MRTTIVGLFDEEESAKFLHQEIQDRGIKERDVETLSWRKLSEGDDPWNINPKGRSDEADITQNLAAHLRGWGVPEEDSRDFAKAVKYGGNIVLARSDDEDTVDEITRLMEKNEAINLDERREMWSKEASHAGEEHDPYANASADVASSVRIPKQHDRGDDTLQEAHEELRIGKKKVPTATVRVHKHVEEEAVDEDITLRTERVEIERKPIERSEAREMEDGLDDDFFVDKTVEYTEYAEEPVVEQEVRLDDTYVAKRTIEEHDETIHDTVRKAVIDIETLNDNLADDRSYERHAPLFREHYDSYFVDLGDYDDYDRAYRYGHAFGASERYAEQSYEQVEPEMRAAFQQQYGDVDFAPYRDAARYAFSSARHS